eukprot:TRINITY_DN9674_c0_g1_i3.p2 TRINITY_DN9674_c0_g1~~TRINITY_DN9674_c0_g1_i3.p2  ORF type:complete len:364 (-),score=60.74 TRINITY_DN9674_c0_g1_i3:434-1504(-)
MSSKLFNTFFKWFLSIVEQNIVPDFILRFGIRYLLSLRLNDLTLPLSSQLATKQTFVSDLKSLPVAIQTDTANEQHYEIPTDYFLLVLGPRLKYSSCLFKEGRGSLQEAEESMLELCCERGEMQNGQRVLELGCGWGSMCLYLAEKYPDSEITAVSNSSTQKEFIDSQAKAKGFKNLTVVTADVVDLIPSEENGIGKFDRVVSIEMFEHMKNYEVLLSRISEWLKPNGKLFVHYFCHKSLAYHFLDENETDWMTRYFFSGGTMPSLDLMLYFQQNLKIEQMWYVNGTHYSKTLEAWLKKQDRVSNQVKEIFVGTYGKDQALKWLVYWRLFYLACSELFNYDKGEQWGVGHYLFTKK